jgi:hypothetical protein
MGGAPRMFALHFFALDTTPVQPAITRFLKRLSTASQRMYAPAGGRLVEITLNITIP